MKKITISIPDDLYMIFKKYCDENGMKVSSLIQVLIKEFLKK